MSALRLDDKGVLTACTSCGKTNRLPYVALGKTVRCGHCKTPLAPLAEPVEVSTAAAFDTLISKASIPVIVDFWAPWCGPCRMVAPELEKVARTTAGEFLVAKINTDSLPDIGQRFRIRSIPTLAIFSNGREIRREAGARAASDIIALVRQALVQRVAS